MDVSIDRDVISKLVMTTWDKYYNGEDYSQEIELLQCQTGYPNIEEYLIYALFHGEQSIEYVSDVLMNYHNKHPNTSVH